MRTNPAFEPTLASAPPIPMLTFRYSTVSNDSEAPVSVGDAVGLLTDMQSRPGWDDVSIVSAIAPPYAPFPTLSLSWYPANGFVLQCFETPESNSDFLLSRDVYSEPSVYVDLGGQAEELWPSELFTPLELAARAVEHFLATGRESPDLLWTGISDFPRRTVRRRRK